VPARGIRLPPGVADRSQRRYRQDQFDSICGLTIARDIGGNRTHLFVSVIISAAESQAATIDIAQFLKSWRGTLGVGARIAEFVCVDHDPLTSVVEKRQADCDSGAGHLLAIIKPKIVRHTIILSTNNLFLLMPANFSKWPAGERGCHKSFNSKFSFAA
jgi:hypothetical protein